MTTSFHVCNPIVVVRVLRKRVVVQVLHNRARTLIERVNVYT
jgi:hypothetical protein